METLRKELNESKEALLDRALAEIDWSLYSRFKVTNPELSASLAEANRRVSRAYRGGDVNELRTAIGNLKELYYRGIDGY